MHNIKPAIPVLRAGNVCQQWRLSPDCGDRFLMLDQTIIRSSPEDGIRPLKDIRRCGISASE
jgi:hypothetical protein